MKKSWLVGEIRHRCWEKLCGEIRVEESDPEDVLDNLQGELQGREETVMLKSFIRGLGRRHGPRFHLSRRRFHKHMSTSMTVGILLYCRLPAKVCTDSLPVAVTEFRHIVNHHPMLSTPCSPPILKKDTTSL